MQQSSCNKFYTLTLFCNAVTIMVYIELNSFIIILTTGHRLNMFIPVQYILILKHVHITKMYLFHIYLNVQFQYFYSNVGIVKSCRIFLLIVPTYLMKHKLSDKHFFFQLKSTTPPPITATVHTIDSTSVHQTVFITAATTAKSSAVLSTKRCPTSWTAASA